MASSNPDPWIVRPSGLNQFGVAFSVSRLVNGQLIALPSVECLSIKRHAGTDPGHASFRYAFDGQDPGAPQSFEQALSTGVTLAETVNPNDRLVVTALRWDGTTVGFFDGYVLDFRMDVDSDSEVVYFLAIGVAKRLWDQPIQGAIYRDASQPQTPGRDFQTDVPAQFNPHNKANMTDKGFDSSPVLGAGGDNKYPVFLDASVCKQRGIGRKATLAMAARYLSFTNNAAGTYVSNVTGDVFDKLFVAREPIPGLPFDPTNAASYTTSDILVSDRPMTCRDWPTVFHELMRANGFDMAFDLAISGGQPTTLLKPFLRQAGPVKSIWLQPAYTDLDPTLTNMGSASLARDLNEVVNAWQVIGAIQRVELSVILSYGFKMFATDSADTNLKKWKKGSDSFDPSAYRLLIFDEAGDGHCLAGSAAVITTPGDFQDVLGVELPGSSANAVRRRPPHSNLISTTDTSLTKDLRQPQLSYSLDYAGPPGPCVWENTGSLQPNGTWQPIVGGWSLMHDRLGVELTMNDPNAWQVGDDHAGGGPKKVNLVELLAAGTTPIYFRLTAVVETDFSIRGLAPRRVGSTPGKDPSPLAESIYRNVDARDRYLYEEIDASSEFNTTGETFFSRDDTDLANAEAISLRTSTECGVMDGTITIPYITDYYDIGDRIDSINGRGLGLRTDGSGQGDTPVLPMVEGITYDLDNKQHTIVHVSDEAAIRHGLERRVRRK